MEITIKMQINKSVSSLPCLLIEFTNRSLTNFTTGFVEAFVSAPKEDEPVLNINSRKGINMPIDTMEKMMESIVHKKYRIICGI